MIETVDSMVPCSITMDLNGEEFRILLIADPHLHHTNPQSRKDVYSEAILTKLGNISKIATYYQADLVIIAGDLFHAKAQPDSFIVKVNNVFSSFSQPVFTILGNHDIYYTNPDTVHRTPTGVILSSNMIKRLGSIIVTNIAGKKLLISGMDFCLNPVIPKDLNFKDFDYSLLVSHQFMPGILEEYSPEEGFKEDDIKGCGFSHIFAGHDHMGYPPSNKLGPLIIRPGAISRGTRNVSNRFRDISFGILSFTHEGASYMQENLPGVLPSSEVLSEANSDRVNLSKRITEFVRSLKLNTVDTKSNIQAILIRLCGNNMALLNYIKAYLTDAGLLV